MREQKSSIRKILRERKDAMDPEDRQEKSRAICRHLMTLIADQRDRDGLYFQGKRGQHGADHHRLLERKNPVIVPIIVKEDVSLRLSYLRDFAALVPSTFGVPEPIGSEIPARGEDVDTIILPMLGFDRTGGRIGYGAGYYDRFLEKYTDLRKIGIAFACQEIDSLPLDETDVRMDHIITEDGIVYP